MTPPNTCSACTPTITYKKEKETLRVMVRPLAHNSLKPKYCKKTKAKPRTTVKKSHILYCRICLLIKALLLSNNVTLLKIITAVE